MDEPNIDSDTESQLFHTERFKGIMHNLLETSNWAISLSESSCFVMDKGFGDISEIRGVPLKYNFVMEKSWQSSNSSRLMRNVRRSVHQVNVNNTTIFFLEPIILFWKSIYFLFLKTGLSVERCGGVWKKRITQSSSLSIITTSVCCLALCCGYHSYIQVINQLIVVEKLILVLSILDIEIIYAAKGKMIPPEKPPIPMQTCRYSWNMTTTDRKSQEKIRNFLKGKTQKYKIIWPRW